jgi:hypothetical protein
MGIGAPVCASTIERSSAVRNGEARFACVQLS